MRPSGPRLTEAELNAPAPNFTFRLVVVGEPKSVNDRQTAPGPEEAAPVAEPPPRVTRIDSSRSGAIAENGYADSYVLASESRMGALLVLFHLGPAVFRATAFPLA